MKINPSLPGLWTKKTVVDDNVAREYKTASLASSASLPNMGEAWGVGHPSRHGDGEGPPFLSTIDSNLEIGILFF